MTGEYRPGRACLEIYRVKTRVEIKHISHSSPISNCDWARLMAHFVTRIRSFKRSGTVKH
jgi:hypothetical protein